LTLQIFHPILANQYKINTLSLVGPVAQRLEQRTHKLRSDTSNKRDSCKLKSLAPLHNPSLPIISDPTTQKERKLNSQLFLLNVQGDRAVIVLGTDACRIEISSVRTVLLGGGLENR